MAKRRNRRAETPRDLRRKKLFWRTAGIMGLALVVLGVGYYMGARRNSLAPGGEDHPHEPGAHGGLLVSLGDDHYHVEIVLAKGGILKLYTLGEDVSRVVEVDSQIVKAQAKPEGAAATEVELMPMPQPSDSEGKTSQFAATLPKEVWDKRLTVRISRISIGGEQLAFEFNTAGFTHDGNIHGNEQDQEKLYHTPGGKYTVADIQANGNQPAPQKYQGFRTRHDARPRPGDRICPVSKTKANPEYTWIIDGNTYVFCCPPCIDEFVRRAKEEPQKIKEPEAYLKK